MQPTHERIIVSVGGSLIVPDAIDVGFLKRFRELILEKVASGFSFVIIAGGGATARRYQNAARAVQGDLSRDDLDWLGIHGCRINAHLLRTIFREQAHAQIIKNPLADVEADEPILVGMGWKPGCSSDYVATLIAKNLGARRLVNLSNIDYVYSADPKKYPDAKKIEKVDWKKFRTLIPKEWDPGLSSPFDPVAAKEAEALGLEVAIINGSALEEFSNYLESKPFKGTIIS